MAIFTPGYSASFLFHPPPKPCPALFDLVIDPIAILEVGLEDTDLVHVSKVKIGEMVGYRLEIEDLAGEERSSEIVTLPSVYRTSNISFLTADLEKYIKDGWKMPNLLEIDFILRSTVIYEELSHFDHDSKKYAMALVRGVNLPSLPQDQRNLIKIIALERPTEDATMPVAEVLPTNESPDKWPITYFSREDPQLGLAFMQAIKDKGVKLLLRKPSPKDIGD